MCAVNLVNAGACVRLIKLYKKVTWTMLKYWKTNNEMFLNKFITITIWVWLYTEMQQKYYVHITYRRHHTSMKLMKRWDTGQNLPSGYHCVPDIIVYRTGRWLILIKPSNLSSQSNRKTNLNQNQSGRPIQLASTI